MITISPQLLADTNYSRKSTALCSWVKKNEWYRVPEPQWQEQKLTENLDHKFFPWRHPIRQLQPLSNFIEKSKWVLELEEDWNDEDALPPSFSTWGKATQFLWMHAEYLYSFSGIIIDIPCITPGPSGEIGYYWKTDNYELLISIPPEKDEKISYYGDNKIGLIKIKGETSYYNLDKKLISWLTLLRNGNTED